MNAHRNWLVKTDTYNHCGKYDFLSKCVGTTDNHLEIIKSSPYLILSPGFQDKLKTESSKFGKWTWLEDIKEVLVLYLQPSC